MNGLKLKIPPPIVALLMGALMWLLAQFTPAMSFRLPANRLLAGCIFALAVVISVSGVFAFKRARTTVNPMKPDTASSLVSSGIYRFTRNPMYVGLLFALLAWAVYLSNILAFLFLPAFVAYMNQFQIRPEESALFSLFGQDYISYKSKVRRWL